jgi:hypothetical protein
VNVLSRLAELLADGANKTTSSDRAGLPAKHHTFPYPLFFPLGQNLGQNLFCSLAKNG